MDPTPHPNQGGKVTKLRLSDRNGGRYGVRLVQLQCLKEGTLFYYQHSACSLPFAFKCPLCGSKRVVQTGRLFDPVDECKPILPTPIHGEVKSDR